MAAFVSRMGCNLVIGAIVFACFIRKSIDLSSAGILLVGHPRVIV